MSARFVEGNLLFKFGDRWTTLFRWDRHIDFINGMARTHEGKAVDFVGVFDRRVPFLIEVKDFRLHARNEGKIRIEHEFEMKVRATVAALLGTRWQEPPAECVAAFEAFRASRKPRLVLWHEDAPPERRDAPQAARLGGSGAGLLRDLIKQNMSWLDAETIVTSLAGGHSLPDVEVESLPPGRKRKAEDVVAILEGRRMRVPQEVRWQIDDCETEDELDSLIQRAVTVLDPWRLFSHRT